MAPIGRSMAQPATDMSMTKLDIALDLVFPLSSSFALPDSAVRRNLALTARKLRFKSRQQRQIEKYIDDTYRVYVASFFELHCHPPGV